MKCESESERRVTKLDQKTDLEIFVKWSLNQPCHNDCGPQKEGKPYHIVTPAEKMIFYANKVVIEKQWINLKQMKVEIEKQSMRPASQTCQACPTTREIMPAEEANEITMKVSWDNQQGWGEQVYSGADWVEIMWQNVKYSNWIVLHITGRFSSSSLLYLRPHFLSIRIRICSCTPSQTPCCASLNIVIISKIVG